MIEFNNPLVFLLFANSLIIIFLILNQNESGKESTTSQNSNLSSNPFEKATWVCLFSQLILLLIKTKITDF